jgi:tetratricopeptide (TPR) repeat protein
MAEKSLNDLPRELRMLFTKGSDALSRENFDYAIEMFTQILAREPTVYDCRKALRTAQLRKAGGGGGMLKKMWSNASSSPMVAKGQLALRKDPVEALQIAEQILNSDAQNSGAHRIIVEAATAMEMPRTAVMSLEILAGNSPKDREVAIKFANILADTGEVVRGEKILSELSASYPGDTELSQALKNLSARRTMQKGGYDALADGKGSFRDILKDKDEAVALEQEQRQVKTEDVTARLIKEYEERLPKEPNNLKLLRSLAELYTQKKQFDASLAIWERVKGSEGGADPSVDKGIADNMLRKYDQQISQLDPTAADYAQQTAKLQAEKQAYQLAECQKRSERFPTDLQIRFELGQLYFQAGKINEAIQEFQKAQSNPNRKVKALSYLGQCYARKNMNDLATRTFENALKEKLVWDEEKKDLTYNLGAVLEKMGRRDDAKRQFEEIFGVDSSYKDVQKKIDGYYGEESGAAA